MKGLMMEFQLTLPVVLRRAETLFADKPVISRLPDKSIHRYTYGEMAERARRLAVALGSLGVAPGDRVATLAWNGYQHLEAYFGIPLSGAILHTLNPRLSGDDLAYIVSNAGDSVLLVDETLLPVYEKFKDRVRLEHVIVMSQKTEAPAGLKSYERLLADTDPRSYRERSVDENDAAAMCYSSGTTGRPKGVLYSHRALVLHSIGEAMVDTLGVSERDVLLPVVPMFHVNAWGLPYTCALVGATLVFPGPHLDAESVLELFEKERVTLAAGVPTVWLGILTALEKEPDRWKTQAGLRMVVGGSAAPLSMIKGFDRHGMRIIHAWGMTETTPLGSVSNLVSGLANASDDARYATRAKQGIPSALFEIRARGESGLIPWDDTAMGELEVRGPWVAASYYNAPGSDDRFTGDGWFKTGDIVSIDRHGYIEIKDRTKDLVKSGGEWISTVALENALMGHPAVAEAAVIAANHPKWQERPLAIVTLKKDKTATAEELIAFLATQFPKWWLPDAVEFVDAIPRTATGKFYKMALRDRFKDALLAKA
ncbi:MAG TPA: long-chain fatty acid--CoA ligase [Candidatus Acidoferrales bacterium]|nr:long-chain fatty acid--CoA ligase [Candidatus Acidoferrales bacterium]